VPQPGRRAAARRRPLARWSDRRGAREIVALPGAGGSTLVIDQARGGGDRRLVAHLGDDEPAGNAELVSSGYLEEARAGAPRCRALRAADMRSSPFPEPAAGEDVAGRWLAGAGGEHYALEPVRGSLRIPELRWQRCGGGEGAMTVSVRAVVARLESYEPTCRLTAAALACLERRPDVSTTTLRLELERVHRSPTVLNRGLREAVLRAVGDGRVSMSEIAIRCGRVKRDGRGNVSGETSWLARRLGLLPEGGQHSPTPWIHTEVLALIARRGLGVSPCEVEL
jgi:hypothetical protein